jgi:hypothetical protein
MTDGRLYFVVRPAHHERILGSDARVYVMPRRIESLAKPWDDISRKEGNLFALGGAELPKSPNVQTKLVKWAIQ